MGNRGLALPNGINTVVTVDPGATGSIAWVRVAAFNGQFAVAESTFNVGRLSPSVLDLLSIFNDAGMGRDRTFVFIEQVGFHRQGNAGRVAAALGRNAGRVEVAAHTISENVFSFMPQVWMKLFIEQFNLTGSWVKGSEPEQYRARKELIHRVVSAKLSRPVFKYAADSLAMLYVILKLMPKYPMLPKTFHPVE